MKQQQFFVLALLTTFMVGLTGCEVVQGIFKAGFWSAIIVVAVIVALVFWLISRGRK